ncbi:NAD(P)H-dependent flavin oxidoreductase [Pseudofrankia inefficax]|uniref:2-nitropropane dioxygenase NPD n=1 Tax=Pseudofrankia inefficax (strain DSM 45817 / CECT 9037 / DDB 130130 / EuI1c) TaxID=298654 RepID=E3ITS6_PSEI1|nr:nitronate monooxygenase [Pseudofrankia inefficax]ADP79973.1 2-nitropropane dioxygenase NPD [Pseudofrankia inefficax]
MSGDPRLETAFTRLTGARYPIVQTGMGWVSGARLTAATSAAGGLGILGSATMTLDQLAGAVRAVKERTDAPFGVNLRSDAEDVEDRVALMVREGVRVASFALAPRKDLFARLRDAGIVTMPSVGARRHAEKVASWGADAVLVQGGEGGGHTGAVPTSLLVPQVVDAVDIPVVAAGGYFDGRGLVAALAYGAAGIGMGTRFLLTADSTVADNVKAHYLAAGVDGTVVTTRVDGVPHRVLRTPLVDGLTSAGPLTRFPRAIRNAAAFRRASGATWRGLLREGRALRSHGGLTWSQVLMSANTPMLLRASMVEGRDDLGLMTSGQVAGLIDDVPTVEELVGRIVAEAAAVLDRLAASGAAAPRPVAVAPEPG